MGKGNGICIEQEVSVILTWLSEMEVQRLPINQYD